MAILFCDSFDAYASKTEVTDKIALSTNGTTWTNYGTFSTTAGKFGGGAITSINGAGAGNNILSLCSFTYSAGYPICMAGCVKISSIQASNGFFGLAPNGTGASMISINSSGQIIFYPLGSGASNAAAGTHNICDNNWHWIEVKLVPNTTTAGSVKVYLDGALELSIASVATISSGTPSSVTIGSSANGANVGFDDLIVWDTTGAAFNTFPLGPRRIACLNPNAAGASTQFTPSAGANYSCVSQAYSGAAYVADTATGNTDLYATLGLTYMPASVINAVMVNVYAINPAGDGSKSLTPKLRSGATPAGTSRTLSGVLANYQSPFYQDATATNWTATTVNAAQPGIGD